MYDNIDKENMVSEAEIMAWLSDHYWDIPEKERPIVRHIEQWLLDKRKQIEPIRKCGTCRYFIKHPNTCMKGWSKNRTIQPGLIGSDLAESMYEVDGQNCLDWEEQYKKERRIWSCLNCGKDIYFLKPTFVHVDSEKFQCSNRIVDYYNVAIPHPDKPMRTE